MREPSRASAPQHLQQDLGNDQGQQVWDFYPEVVQAKGRWVGPAPILLRGDQVPSWRVRGWCSGQAQVDGAELRTAMGQADEGERKTPLFNPQGYVTLPFKVDGEAPGERWAQCRVLGGGRPLNQRAQVGSLTPLLTHISEPQLPWRHECNDRRIVG